MQYTIYMLVTKNGNCVFSFDRKMLKRIAKAMKLDESEIITCSLYISGACIGLKEAA